ncbi:MAG: hypothetical protein DVB32_08620 [Verrucomicrobia bacterium]|jgi:hypothetical protein|nr:MAG: hypothetical protein DVB32_08620 [Verrucomicrobiota bacterium]
MKAQDHLNQLVRLARKIPVDSRVPYAFEKRIMARLPKVQLPDLWTLWGRMLWRSAVPCLGVMILATAWSGWLDNPSDLSDIDLEAAIQAPIQNLVEASW